MGCALLHFYPKQAHCTPLGLIDKYNVSRTLEEISASGCSMRVCVGDGGVFAAYMLTAPTVVKVDGVSRNFRYENGLVFVDIPVDMPRRFHEVLLSW